MDQYLCTRVAACSDPTDGGNAKLAQAAAPARCHHRFRYRQSDYGPDCEFYRRDGGTIRWRRVGRSAVGVAGRAMAIAMAGTPLALSIGIPAGAFIGNLAGWRLTFGLLSGIALLLVGWIIAKVPDFAGEPETQRPSLAQVFVVPGVRPVLAVTLCFVLAHNLLYTYIATLLAGQRMTGQIDSVLLVFGVSALVSIGLTGVLIDKWLRPLTFTGIGLFLVEVLILAVTTEAPLAIYGAALIWGLAFGGSATLFQTASAHAAGPAADVAQAMIVTAWNIAIFGGAVMGGVILETAGAGGLSWAGIALLAGAAGSALCMKR